ncbi:MAG TPA: ATP-binding cassette domain-containing protein, partial [Candidatus Deferrimicrobium sp.]|nr:ATP-binding cassette domain-containing protein [Candidatus Deferrimicrobium sp.]
MIPAPVLDVEGITKRFGGLTATEDVSFTVDPGEILSIIGPNGAGKSTLFNCITGFYRPDAGKVLFRGKDITTASAHKICKLGIARTFQIVQVISDMTVLENVMTGSFLRTYDRKKVREKAVEILRFAGLQEKMDFLGT